jgi:hypothetical protein
MFFERQEISPNLTAQLRLSAHESTVLQECEYSIGRK